MIRIAIVVLGSLAALVLLVVAIGYALPVAPVASRSATVHQPPDAVFVALTDVAHFADWRTDVTSVEVLSTAPLRWRERGSNGDITFVIDEAASPSRVVTRIDDPSLPFAGTWTYELVPGSGGTTVTITERGEVYNPVFRFMSRFVFGQTGTIDACLTALQKHLG
jgi:uncharacterized protein YndB with AHSA1/START domain